MSLRRLIAVALAPFRRPDTTPEALAVEAEIDELPESVRRARAGMAWQAEQRRKGVRVEYGLGWGGKDPDEVHPYEYDKATRTWRCDCSGAVAHQQGIPRKIDGYGYVWTDGLVRDARKDVPGDLGYEVPRDQVQVGDLLVQGSIDKDGDGDRDVVGHVGRVVAVAHPFMSLTESVTVIDCASRPKPGGHIEGKRGHIWEARGVVMRLR